MMKKVTNVYSDQLLPNVARNMRVKVSGLKVMHESYKSDDI